MKRLVPIAVAALLVCPRLQASEPSRAFAPAGSFSIDWDIGFTIPPGWPPMPVTGGPGARYGVTDSLALGLRVHVAAFFQGMVQLEAFCAWRFLNPTSGFPRLAASLSTVATFQRNAPLRIRPTASLCLGAGNGVVDGYLSLEASLWTVAGPVAPFVELNARAGVVFPRVESLSLELGLLGIGRYSSVTRSAVGQPVVTLGMINTFRRRR